MESPAHWPPLVQGGRHLAGLSWYSFKRSPMTRIPRDATAKDPEQGPRIQGINLRIHSQASASEGYCTTNKEEIQGKMSKAYPASPRGRGTSVREIDKVAV